MGEVIHNVHSKLCGCFKLKFVCGGVYVDVRLLYYIGQDLFRLGFNSPTRDLSLVIELSLDFDVEKFSIIKTCNHFKLLLPMTRKWSVLYCHYFKNQNPYIANNKIPINIKWTNMI
jgi:hypothetical protein